MKYNATTHKSANIFISENRQSIVKLVCEALEDKKKCKLVPVLTGTKLRSIVYTNATFSERYRLLTKDVSQEFNKLLADMVSLGIIYREQQDNFFLYAI